MKKIIAFGASSSRKSINRKLANHVANQLHGVNVKLLDLNDFEMPIFSIDREQENGIHELAHQFKQEIKNADGIVISFAEHNSAYSAAFKNIYDWVSRIAPDVWEGKPMFLAATSPGSHGGKSVLELATNRFKRRNLNTIVTFSLPSFGKNFSAEGGILDENLRAEFETQLKVFELSVSQ
jgi:NAD(P)H-dependent FMN reductase